MGARAPALLWSVIAVGDITRGVNHATKQMSRAWWVGARARTMLWSVIAAGGIIRGVNHATKQMSGERSVSACAPAVR